MDNNQGQGFYRSICIEDQFAGLIAVGNNGKRYVCIEDLRNSPFSMGRNGKTSMAIGVRINEGVDQYGNIAGITLAQTKQEYEAREKKQYIGNLRRSGQDNGTAASPGPQQQYQQPQHSVAAYKQQYQQQQQQPQQPLATRFDVPNDLPF